MGVEYERLLVDPTLAMPVEVETFKAIWELEIFISEPDSEFGWNTPLQTKTDVRTISRVDAMLWILSLIYWSFIEIDLLKFILFELDFEFD